MVSSIGELSSIGKNCSNFTLLKRFGNEVFALTAAYFFAKLLFLVLHNQQTTGGAIHA
jgi:hypothetical protein